MPRRLLPLLLLLLALPAAAQQGVAARPTPLVVVAGLPAQAGGFQRGELTDFETRPNGAGLGAAAEYRPPAAGGGVATVYVYDRGGVATPEAIPAEMDGALKEVLGVAALRQYRVEGALPLAEAPPPLRCQALALAFEGGARADGFLCLGVVQGRFLKIRMTLPASPPPTGADRLRSFAAGILAALG